MVRSGDVGLSRTLRSSWEEGAADVDVVAVGLLLLVSDDEEEVEVEGVV